MSGEQGASGRTVVEDSLGRKLVVSPLDPGDMLNLFEAAGDQNGNPGWLRMAMVVASVREIDGVPLVFPQRKAQVIANGRLLRNEGLVAVTPMLFPDDREADAEAQKEAAKN